MVDLEVVVALAVGLLAGGVVGFLFSKLREAAERESLKVELSAREERIRNLDQRVESLEGDLIKAEREKEAAIKNLEAQHASVLEKKAQESRVAMTEQQLAFEKLEARMKEAFQALSSELLEEKGRKFAVQNEEKIDALLKPLKEKLQTFEKEVRETREKNVADHSTLREQIRLLAELNQQLSRDANSLVKALEGQTKTQGDWGEVILERILETAGLQKGIHFERERTLEHEDGQRVRPDVIVKLPGDRFLIVDSKVSIVAYRRYCDAETDEERTRHLKAHMQAVRSHVGGLGAKRYEDLYGSKSPDFVLLFIPVEPAFGLALMHDETLYEEAFKKNIVLVSPTTLLATMAMVQNLWKHENRSQNIQKIAERGALLFDKFVGFTEALEEVGTRLRQTQDSYERAWVRLKSGQGNLLGQAEKLRRLGIKAKKELPASLADAVDDALEDDEEEMPVLSPFAVRNPGTIGPDGKSPAA